MSRAACMTNRLVDVEGSSKEVGSVSGCVRTAPANTVPAAWQSRCDCRRRCRATYGLLREPAGSSRQ
eukprot:392262-Pleurochrysis_carterae.AAC.1